MANKRGWWKVTATGTETTNIDDDEPFELSDCDREHIGHMIAQGYTEGEIVQDN